MPETEDDRGMDNAALSDKIDRLSRRVDEVLERSSRVQGAASFEYRDGAINLRAVIVVGTIAFGALGFGVGTEVGEGDPTDVLEVLDLLEERVSPTHAGLLPGTGTAIPAAFPSGADCDPQVRTIGDIMGFTVVGRLASGLDAERYEAERDPGATGADLPARLTVNCMQMGAGAPVVWLEAFDEAN